MKKTKKPLGKIWCTWLVAGIVAIAAIAVSGCEEETNVSNQNEATGDSSNGTTEEKEETKTRDNSSAEAVTLGAGTFTVGKDVKAGRYVITGSEGGNFVVYDESGSPVVNEVLGGGDMGVESVTADLEKGQEINISGINTTTFTPAETTLRTSLTTGNWEVGLDISEGSYKASPTSGDSGNFVVYRSGLPVVNEILGGENGVENVSVKLKEGDIISISGIKEVKFE